MTETNDTPSVPTETVLTPELAIRLLSNRHPKQRRAARSTVAEYTRRIKEGRWRLVPDPIMVDPEGRLFNGGHRCEAVVAANRAIPVYIMWGADPDLFDVIDVGRFRSPYQFITERNATERASAARVTLWYERRFDRALNAQSIGFDLHEILGEAERRTDAFEAVLVASRQVYEYTTIAKSVSLAAFAIAYDMGYIEEIEAFAAGVIDPNYLPPDDPARLLSERFRKQSHRSRRRAQGDDWTLLVYAFNLQIEGARLGKLIVSDVWPRVAESTADYRRRQSAIHKARSVAAAGNEVRAARAKSKSA